MARPFFKQGFALAIAGSLAAAITLPARSASADPVNPTGKGIAGGALLGAEAVVTIEALAGVDKPWAYAVGVIVGGGLGGVGGYFAEKGSDPHLPLYLLAGGMALVVPAAILALNATSYRPPEDYENEKPIPGGDRPADAPGAQPGPAVPPKTSLRWQPNGYYAPMPAFRRFDTSGLTGGAVSMTGSGIRMGVPAVEVRPLYSVTELQKFGMAQKEELRVPLFRAVFLGRHQRAMPW